MPPCILPSLLSVQALQKQSKPRPKKALEILLPTEPQWAQPGNPKQWWKEAKDLVGKKTTSYNLQGLANTVCGLDMQEMFSRIN